MNPVEGGPHRRHRLFTLDTLRDLDRDLVAFAHIAHVGAAPQLDALTGHALGHHLVLADALQLPPGAVDLARVRARLLAHQGADIVALDVGDVQAEGGEIARIGGRENPPDGEEVRDLGREHAARAAEGREHVAAGLPSPACGDLADAVDLVGGGDLEDAGRGLLRAEVEARAEPDEGRPRRLGIEGERAADEAARQAAEHEGRVGDRGPLTPPPVADRPRVGARALRPHLQRAVIVHPGERAAAGAHGRDVEHGRLDRIVLDQRLAGELGLEPLDQRDVGRGAADIEGEHILEARKPGHVDRPQHTRRRA